jgi:GxxExxY protein
MKISDELNQLCYKVIGLCMEVHREMGPGFPEEYYQKALEHELTLSKVTFRSQEPAPMLYKGVQVGMNYLDFVIEDKVILEIKSVNQLTNEHLFQVLKYLSVSKHPLALLVNFGKSSLESERVLPTMKMQKFREKKQK